MEKTIIKLLVIIFAVLCLTQVYISTKVSNIDDNITRYCFVTTA